MSNEEQPPKKLTRAEKRKKNRRRWQQLRYTRKRHRREKKERLAMHAMAGDVQGKYKILLMRNGRRSHSYYTSNWSIAANEKFNEMIEQNRKEVRFPVEVLTTPRRTQPYECDLLLVQILGEGESPLHTAPIRDKDGKLIKAVFVDNENVVVLRRERWFVEEKFSMTGPHPYRQRQDFAHLCDMIMSSEGLVRIFTLGLRLVLLRDDSTIDCVRCKSDKDCRRLYSALEKDPVSKHALFLGEAEGDLSKWIVDRLVERTGRPRRAFLRTGYLN